MFVILYAEFCMQDLSNDKYEAYGFRSLMYVRSTARINSLCGM